jgi:hypothetical protein
MSLGLATKGILPDFTGTGTGVGETIIEYVGSLIVVEVEMDVVEINAELISDTISVTNSGVITVEVEVVEDQITTEELSVDVFVESNEIEIEVNPCQV